jgi:methionyl-tRNA synthetase
MSVPVLTAVAWPYANGPRHIGHVSGFGVPSDVFARYQRMAGNKVLMVSGTDEHGTPIQVQADKEGLTARGAADKYNRQIATDLQGLGLSYDLFTRTTTGNHYRVVQELFLALHRNGYVIPKTQLGAVSPTTGRTLPDRYIEGTCPICGYDGARGDQCDNCGNQLDPADLKNPRSRINGETPKFVETEHLFLDLPAFTEALGKWLATRTEWRPNVLKFSENLLGDLRPRAITRDLDWGVPVPLDGWRDAPMKRLYVWFDAVIGYLSASVEWARRSGDPDAWREFWANPDAIGHYFMGKDNIVFHSVIWPALLLGRTARATSVASRAPSARCGCPTRSSPASSSP